MQAEDKFQFHAASLLIDLHEVKGVTERAITSVTNGVNTIFESFIDILVSRFLNKCGHDDAMSFDEISSLINDLRGQNVFEGLDSRTKLDTYIDSVQGLVKPQKIIFSTKDVIKGSTVKKVPMEWGYYIPFLPSLEKVLSCPEVLHCVENPLPHQPGVFRTALDGAFYQNHPVVQEDPCTLGIGIYTDGVEMTDSASSKSNIHGLTFVYWVLFNIHPDKRATIRSKFLLAVVKNSYVKKYGYDKILSDFVDGMNKLSSSGVNFKLSSGATKLFHGIFINSSGDNPASANLGGYKESASFSHKPCRQCYVSQEELYTSFKESDFVLRTGSRHLIELEQVEAFCPAPNLQDPSVTFGINRRSKLMSIEGCDVTKCLPQDLMHDVIEGTLKRVICCTLNHVVEKKILSLKDINERIRVFSKFVGVNKPGTIDATHLTNMKLKATAAEAWNLAHILPFVLRKKNFMTGKIESACDPQNLHLLILNLNSLDLLVADEQTMEDLHRIGKLIETQHKLFQELYPGYEIPKMHYSVHFVTHILLFGPPHEFWCFGFERKHAFFRRRCRLYRTLKDHAGTLALAHQRNQCGLMLLSAKGNLGPFLGDSDRCGASVSKLVSSLAKKDVLLRSVPNLLPNQSVLEYRVVHLKGVTYRKKSIFVIRFDRQGPLFGKILSIYRVEEKLIFVYQKLDTIEYVKDLNAFKVKHTSEAAVQQTEQIPYRHKLHFILSVGACYVVVPCKSYLSSKDYTSDELED